jgi:hypothetical protein
MAKSFSFLVKLSQDRSDTSLAAGLERTHNHECIEEQSPGCVRCA